MNSASCKLVMSAISSYLRATGKEKKNSSGGLVSATGPSLLHRVVFTCADLGQKIKCFGRRIHTWGDGYVPVSVCLRLGTTVSGRGVGM